MKHRKDFRRIVIIGSAGVGKTTLFNALKEKIKTNLIPEQARIVCKNLGFNTIYEIKEPHNFRFLVLQEQIKLENKFLNFLSDRSCIDSWIFWMRWSWNNNLSNLTEKYFEKAKHQANKYSHIIYIPYNPKIIKPINDGFRWNDVNYQTQIDRLFQEILISWGLMQKTHIVKAINLKQRIDEVLGFINNQ